MGYVVLDTDVCSFMFKGDTRICAYRPHLSGRIPCLSFQTVAELRQWAETRRWGTARRDQMNEWLSRFVILYPDLETCQIWAHIRAERERSGQRISPQDAWIAACAQQRNYPLITHNGDDFQNISELQVMTTEVD